jgi:hypothetical protein
MSREIRSNKRNGQPQDLLLSDYPIHFINSTLSPSMEVCRGIQSSKKSWKVTCLCIFTLCWGRLTSWNASGTDTDPGQYLQQNMPLRIHVRTKPPGDTQHMVHCVCSIQPECGRKLCWGNRKATSCVAWRTQCLRQWHLEKSKLVQHAYEGHLLIVGMKPRDQQKPQEI